jgi:hypothetical protein
MLGRTGSIARFAVLDWIVILLCVIGIIIIELSTFPSGFVPFISSDISHPIKSTTLPSATVFAMVFGFVPLILTLLSIIAWRSLAVLHALSAYFFAVLFTHFITRLLGHVVGRPRPDAVNLCGGSGSYDDCLSVLSRREAVDEFRSFPSLEASISMASALFASLFLNCLWDSTHMFSALFQLLPISAALFFGALKIMDRANHVDDVSVDFASVRSSRLLVSGRSSVDWRFPLLSETLTVRD